MWYPVRWVLTVATLLTAVVTTAGLAAAQSTSMDRETAMKIECLTSSPNFNDTCGVDIANASDNNAAFKCSSNCAKTFANIIEDNVDCVTGLLSDPELGSAVADILTLCGFDVPSSYSTAPSSESGGPSSSSFSSDPASAPNELDAALVCLDTEGDLTAFENACGQAILDWSNGAEFRCPQSCANLFDESVSSSCIDDLASEPDVNGTFTVLYGACGISYTNWEGEQVNPQGQIASVPAAAPAPCDNVFGCLSTTQAENFNNSCYTLLVQASNDPRGNFVCNSQCSAVFDNVSQDCINSLASDSGSCFPTQYQYIFRACGVSYRCIGSCPSLPPISSPPAPPPPPSSSMMHCKVQAGINLMIGALAAAAAVLL